MPAQLFEIPFIIALGMSAAIFACILLPMFILSCICPKLTTDAHENTRWLDGLRGLAAATVSLNHAPLVIHNLQQAPTIFPYTPHDIALFKFFGSMGVQFFFCITGVLFADKILFAEKINWTAFYRKRLLRLVPGYFAACVLALVIAAWYSWPVKEKFKSLIVELPSIFSFGLMPLPNVNSFDFVRLIGVNWSLALEWRFYVMLPIIFILHRKFRWFAVVGVVVFAVSDVILTGASFWVFFVSGAMCAPIMRRQFAMWTRVTGYIVASAILVVYACYGGKFAGYGPERWVLMTGLFSSLVIIRPWILTTKTIVAMGTVSYSFYLLHVMIIFTVFEVFHIYFMGVTFPAVPYFTIFACASMAFAVMLSTISYLYVERPFMHL